ncbi:MAG: hypothetical protein JNM40_12480 [Myxococcales bacterium]|nr:hypothetical protein [Myxococcales bacterium]
MNATSSRSLGRLLVGGALALLVLWALWSFRRGERASLALDPAFSTDGTAAGKGTNGPAGAGGPQPGGVTVATAIPSGQPIDPMAQADSPALRAERRRLAEERLATYRKFAQYPPHSRPAREHSDKLFPLSPVVRGLPLSLSGVPSDHILLKLRQDKLVLVGDELLELGIRCEDSQGQVLPCTVQRAQVSTESPDPSKSSRPLSFLPDDAPGRSGELIAQVRPASLGLCQSTCPLLIDVKLQAGRDPVEQGSAQFDVLFTPDPPAVSQGPVQEAVVDGSLTLTYPILVKRPGRYVLTARVDDAAGKPVALIDFNDLLPVGAQRVKLVLFGKLLRDENPRWPLKVRDFDGFLLKESGYPDREQIPTRGGHHHTTQTYSLSAFSSAEWQSEEKTRHEREFEKDVQQEAP